MLNRASTLDTAPAFSPFTGVKLWLDDTNIVFSGNETGRVLEADLPWATQEIADSVLASIKGFKYQPFSAQNALLDPAAELGDGVSVGGVYSVLAACDTNFNAMCASNISAPSDEEIDHEYHYTTPEKRLERRVSKMTSELRVMSDRIEGVVEDVEGNYAEFQQTAEGLTIRVESAEGIATEAQQTANGFSQRITDAEGTASEALQTANGFSQRITDAEGAASEATQAVDAFELRLISAEGDIVEIHATLDGVAFKSSLADGTTVINGGCITTGTIDANKVNIQNLTVSNGNITSLDVGKLTVNGAAITASNPWDTTYHSTAQLISPADGYVVLDAYGVNSVYGSNPAGSVSWNKIVEVAQGGGTSTAVFG